ncbi:MAG: heavy metal translocating P-type ATPase [Treponema sp.]|nr:heavy metal translocating P-type ATPase [Candidatus Treponema scatequi]
MKLFDVSGMSCASCVSHVESAVREVKGVKSVEVNLLTSSMSVEFENEDKSLEVIEAVSKAGYEAKIHGQKKNKINSETKKLFHRFLIAAVLMIPLMYFAMGAEKNLISAIIQAVISLAILIINRKFFISGTKAVFNMAPNMDTLVAMGSGVSYLFSLYNLSNNNFYNLYFESAAMIVTLITIGKTLESYSKGKTTDALKSLAKLAPKTAIVIRDEKEIETPIDQVLIGDIVVVKTGDSVPVDGIITKGSASFNESTLTGESIPCDKSEGQNVFAATLCVSGNVFVRVEKSNDQTAFSKIVELVTSASASKAPIAKIADKVSAVFVPAVLGIAVITFLCHFVSDYIFYGAFSMPIFSEALSFAICVLVISCPCSLGLATPVSIMVANGIAAKRKILFKTASALENVSKINICVFDKTGTITNGTPVVKNIFFAEDAGEEQTYLLSLIYSLEKKSSHPLALAICRYCEEKKISLLDAENFEEKIAFGIKATVDGKQVCAGNEKYIFNLSNSVSYDEKNNNLENSTINKNKDDCEKRKETCKKIQKACDNGETPVYFSVDEKFVLAVTLLDVAKTTSAAAVEELKKLNIEPVLLTGDNEKTARAVAASVEIEKVFAEVTPEEKAKIVSDLAGISKKVAMVGDGVNDAPSLKTAFIGFAVGCGTDVAIDAADVVLVKNDLRDVVKAVKISRKAFTNIKENLFWAFFYNVICIPVAAGVFASSGIILKPMFGALAMSLSSFCVVMNALRLNLMKLEKNVKKTIRINGMMCEHCEAHVKKALESLGMSAVVSHKEGTAIVEAPDEIPPETIKKAVTDAGYEVIEIS